MILQNILFRINVSRVQTLRLSLRVYQRFKANRNMKYELSVLVQVYEVIFVSVHNYVITVISYLGTELIYILNTRVTLGTSGSFFTM